MKVWIVSTWDSDDDPGRVLGVFDSAEKAQAEKARHVEAEVERAREAMAKPPAFGIRVCDLPGGGWAPLTADEACGRRSRRVEKSTEITEWDVR